MPASVSSAHVHCDRRVGVAASVCVELLRPWSCSMVKLNDLML